MKIQILYFAVFRERIGRDTETLELPDGARVRDAIEALAARHAAVHALRGRFRVAVNQDFTDDDHALADRDELALIPPVAGGMGPEGPEGARGMGPERPEGARGMGPERPEGARGTITRHVRLLDEPLSLDRCLAAVTGPNMGGVVTFTGMVRRHSRGTTVERLEYEAYPPMAIREMTRLCDEIEAEVAGARLAVEHRVGRLAIGDLAVVIAAAAPHRAEAFTACRAMIDRLKDRVPIWKKELGEDGAVWVGLGP